MMVVVAQLYTHHTATLFSLASTMGIKSSRSPFLVKKEKKPGY
jgi:hypothetical protein